MKKRKAAALLTATVILQGCFLPENISFFRTEVFSVQAEDIVCSGQCGLKMEWKMDSNGVVTISGKGFMDEYDPNWAHGCGSSFYKSPFSYDKQMILRIASAC